MSSRLKTPSQRSIDLYNQLVAKQNKVRKTLRKIHKEAEASQGAGRLPALVIPKNAHKIKQSKFKGLSRAKRKAKLEAFWADYRELRDQFAGADPLRKYIAKTVTAGYRALFRDLIGIEPEANGYYSKGQIATSDELTGKYMELFNKMFRYGNEMHFYKLLITGNILEFKYFYREFMYGNENENTFVEEQLDVWKRANTIEARMQLDEALKQISPELYKELHKEETRKKAQNKMQRDLETERMMKNYYENKQKIIENYTPQTNIKNRLHYNSNDKGGY